MPCVRPAEGEPGRKDREKLWRAYSFRSEPHSDLAAKSWWEQLLHV